MRQYLYLLPLVYLAACAEMGGNKPATSSSSSDPYKSTAPTTSTATTAAPVKRGKLENSPLVWRPTTKVSSLGSVDLTGMGNVKLQVDKVADGRQNPTLLG